MSQTPLNFPAVEFCWNILGGSTCPEAASLSSSLKPCMQEQPNSLPGNPSFGGFWCSVQTCRTNCYVWQLREAGQLLPSRPPEQLKSTQLHQHTFVHALTGFGVPVLGASQSTFKPFQLADEPTLLHNPNCNGMFNVFSNDVVSCSVHREVKGWKLLMRYGVGPAPPALVCG
eukprot:1160006-Pelagomonas_calceolata.AAC.2